MDKEKNDPRHSSEYPEDGAGGGEGPRSEPVTDRETDTGTTEQEAESRRRSDRATPELVRELATEASQLVRQEMALARAEMHEKVVTYQKATVRMATGGALLFAGLLVVLWAVNTGLTALLSQWVALDVAVWLAPLILAVLLGVLGYALVKGAQSTMQGEGLSLGRTRDSLRKDQGWARTRGRQLKEEVRHE